MLIKCSECGADVSDKAESCPKCGNPIANRTVASYVRAIESHQDQFFSRIAHIERERHERELNKSNKSRVAYVLLGLCLGWIGIHNFYIGRAGQGVAQIMLFVLSCILSFIVIGFVGFFALTIWILINICSNNTDADGRQLS